MPGSSPGMTIWVVIDGAHNVAFLESDSPNTP
jgi:hypothetical protein